MSLTTLILTHNNEGTLQNTLDSLSPLDINLIVGDVSSTDKTRSICRKSDAVIKTVNPDNERSYEKNELLEDVTGWILYIEPWEVLAAGYEDINKVINSDIPNVYGGKVFHGESITKEIKFIQTGGAGRRRGCLLRAKSRLTLGGRHRPVSFWFSTSDHFRYPPFCLKANVTKFVIPR